MTVTIDTVLQNAPLPPDEDRFRIAARLIESVDAADDAELSPTRCAEIDRRIESARIGTSAAFRTLKS